MHEELLHFRAGPGRFPEEFQTRGNARVGIEAANFDPLPQFFPAIVVDEAREDLLEGDTVERVFVRVRLHRGQNQAVACFWSVASGTSSRVRSWVEARATGAP